MNSTPSVSSAPPSGEDAKSTDSAAVGEQDRSRRYRSQSPEERTLTTATNMTAPLAPDDVRLAAPIFTLREAATHLAVPQTTLARWAKGGVTTVAGGRLDARLPFVEFAEAYVLVSLRKAGVPMQRIQPAVEILREGIGIEHALASRRLYTDGSEVLAHFLEDVEPQHLELTVVRTGQKQLSEVVQGYLRHITYGDDGWAAAISLPAYGRTRVDVDPKRAFGRPLVRDGGARVEDLVDRFLAGETITSIAADFVVPLDQVEDVIRVATKAAASSA